MCNLKRDQYGTVAIVSFGLRRQQVHLKQDSHRGFRIFAGTSPGVHVPEIWSSGLVFQSARSQSQVDAACWLQSN